MGKVIKFLMLLCCVTLITACNDEQSVSPQEKASIVQLSVEQATTPTFDNVDSFVNYTIDYREKARFVDVCNTLSLKELKEMSKVILQREGYIDYKLLLKEYDTSYQRVYRYLNSENEDVSSLESASPNKNDTIVVNNITSNSTPNNGTTSNSNSIHRK